MSRRKCSDLNETAHLQRQLQAANNRAAEWQSRFMKIWTANHDGFYYVQSGGTNPGNGYPDSPRATIPTDAPPKSLVIIK